MTDAPLTFYNSLTRSIEPFTPIDPDLVRIYTCGPTVYNYQHIGNMRAFLFADTLGRVLRWKGYKTKHVINITDVGHLTSDADAGDDKMEKAAAAQAKSIWEIAAHYTAAFKEDVARLNIEPPAEWTVATDHIPQMIEFAKAIEKDCYLIDGGLYFDTTRVPDYGSLARAVSDEGASRIDPVSGKRHPQDFAIWRRSPPGEQRQMEWDSPWGLGAPGWHLECSVMSRQHLGHPFDIHTGGIDHREIHHPNEIAQNQAHCGCADTGARVWMHNNFLVDRGSKMSKSTGEFLRLQTLIDAGFHPLAYRMMCLQAHYRSELEFTWENLTAASRRLYRLVLAVRRVRPDSRAAALIKVTYPEGPITDPKSFVEDRAKSDALLERYLDRFDRAISNDLGTPECLLVLEELVKNKVISKRSKARGIAIMDQALGLDLVRITRRRLRVTKTASKAPIPIVRADIDAIVKARRLLRQAGNRELADEMRNVLSDWGVEVMDGDPLGWDWKPTI